MLKAQYNNEKIWVSTKRSSVSMWLTDSPTALYTSWETDMCPPSVNTEEILELRRIKKIKKNKKTEYKKKKEICEKLKRISLDLLTFC